jgi:hypothetical protein
LTSKDWDSKPTNLGLFPTNKVVGRDVFLKLTEIGGFFTNRNRSRPEMGRNDQRRLNQCSYVVRFSPYYPLVMTNIAILKMVLIEIVEKYPAVKWWIFPVRYVFTFTRG